MAADEMLPNEAEFADTGGIAVRACRCSSPRCCIMDSLLIQLKCFGLQDFRVTLYMKVFLISIIDR